MKLSAIRFYGVPAPLLALLFVHVAARPVAAQDSTFQIVALNRLMQVTSDAMLPLSFDVPGAPGTQPLSAQVADVWYCDGNQNATASAVVVVLPPGATLPKRIATQADCTAGTLDNVISRLKALQPRPASSMAAPPFSPRRIVPAASASPSSSPAQM